MSNPHLCSAGCQSRLDHQTVQGMIDYTRASHCYVALASIVTIRPATWLAFMDAAQLPVQAFFDERRSKFAAHCTDKQYAQLCQALAAPDETQIVAALCWESEEASNSVLCPADAAYPATLLSLDSPPLVLFVKGSVATLHSTQIAIVGSRRASHNGLHYARHFAHALSQAGITVTSGLALGIDGAAHQGALQATGVTNAVMGTGPDVIYPKRHRALHQAIVEGGGAVVSEFFPAEVPRPYNFPRRNRIIAALSRGTLVIEATIRSGTLITANLAADMGRDVFVLPGSIDNPLSAGCHHLLKQGAILTTCYEDVLAEWGEFHTTTQITRHRKQKSQDESLATDKLLASVNYDVTSIDIITERSNLPVSDVLATLLHYELRGLVAAVPGGYVKLRGK